MKQASDVRQPHAAPKVRTPPRQASNATIEAVFSDDQPTRDTARGDERTNHRHTSGAISFRCPVGDGERHDARCGHSNKISRRPLRAAGRATITNRLTLIAATPARAWRGACLSQGTMTGTGRRASPKRMRRRDSGIRPVFCPARLRRSIERRLIRPMIFYRAAVALGIEQPDRRFEAG